MMNFMILLITENSEIGLQYEDMVFELFLGTGYTRASFQKNTLVIRCLRKVLERIFSKHEKKYQKICLSQEQKEFN